MIFIILCIGLFILIRKLLSHLFNEIMLSLELFFGIFTGENFPTTLISNN